MGGRLGEMVDRYHRMTMKEYNDVVEMCQMHGVPVSKAVLGKGKAVQACSFLKSVAGFIDQTVAAVHLMLWSILLVTSSAPRHIPLGFVSCALRFFLPPITFKRLSRPCHAGKDGTEN